MSKPTIPTLATSKDENESVRALASARQSARSGRKSDGEAESGSCGGEPAGNEDEV
jgi:hypothetical protein